MSLQTLYMYDQYDEQYSERERSGLSTAPVAVMTRPATIEKAAGHGCSVSRNSVANDSLQVKIPTVIERKG